MILSFRAIFQNNLFQKIDFFLSKTNCFRKILKTCYDITFCSSEILWSEIVTHILIFPIKIN